LSARNGGKLQPHQTHQSGRDVDVSYLSKWDGKSRVTWQHMNKRNFDAAENWRFLELLVKESQVEVIFMDRSLQRLLLDYAKRKRLMRTAKLKHWLEVASPPDGDAALVR